MITRSLVTFNNNSGLAAPCGHSPVFKSAFRLNSFKEANGNRLPWQLLNSEFFKKQHGLDRRDPKTVASDECDGALRFRTRLLTFDIHALVPHGKVHSFKQ